MTKIDVQYKFDSNITATLQDAMGTDLDIALAAWVSTRGELVEEGSDKITPERLEGFLNFLMREEHFSPTEHTALKFLVHAPLFVWRQHMKHRIGVSYNEKSLRYSLATPHFFLPDESRQRVGKVGQYRMEPVSAELSEESRERKVHSCVVAYNMYLADLDAGIAEEEARMVLPVNIFSSAYVTFNVRSLMHFLHLRMDEHAQKEINDLAEIYAKNFEELFPLTFDAFIKYDELRKTLFKDLVKNMTSTNANA